MAPIAGSASITEKPDTIAKAVPPHTHFGVAESLMPGVKILAAASSVPAFALAFVAAHVLECLLILLCQTKILASDHVGKYNVMC